MKLMILHLSDLHIHSGSEVILTRAKTIVDAIKNIEYEVDAVAMIVSGDVAFSGEAHQYEAAYKFLADVSNLLQEKITSQATQSPIPIWHISVPGNHDLKHSESNSIRDILLDRVVESPDSGLDLRILETLVSPQEEYEAFETTFHNLSQDKSDDDANCDLCKQYQVTYGEINIRFICCNTAWISRLNENQGAIAFPVKVLPSTSQNYDLSLTIFHHPYNWFTEPNMHPFRKAVESISDYIFTGHEHHSSYREYKGLAGEHASYIEGSALSMSTSEESAFNVLLVNTDERRNKFWQFYWKEGHYNAKNNNVAWTPYQLNHRHERNPLSFSDEWKEELDDPNLPLIHSKKRKVTLSDVYVYPDLVEQLFSPEDTPRRVRSNEVETFVQEKQCLLITGDSQSGKTSLAKQIVKMQLLAGSIPIYIQAQKNMPVGENLYKRLDTLFSNQYQDYSTLEFERRDKKDRVVIVDDFHTISRSNSRRQTFLNSLLCYAGSIVLLADDLALTLEDVVGPGNITTFEMEFVFFSIQPFGHRRRQELISKWLLLDDDYEDTDGYEAAIKLQEIKGLVDTFIGQNFVASYPVFILGVLQARESAKPVDINASTHGYFYELFIRTAIAKASLNLDQDLAVNFLSFLAYKMFESENAELSYETVLTLAREYQDVYKIKFSIDGTIEGLTKENLLKIENGNTYSFRFSFIYYYFVGIYLRNRLQDEDIKKLVQRMAEEVYVDEYANILMFLAHLSKDPAIISELLQVAEKILESIPMLSLEGDVEFLDVLNKDYEVLELDADLKPEENQQQRLQEMDEFEEDSKNTNSGDDFDFLNEINAALSTIQIIGQLLKNFAGSIEGDLKIRMTDCCYRLGLRLGFLFCQLIQEHKTEYAKILARQISARHSEYPKEKVSQKAYEGLLALSHACLTGLIRRVSFSVASPKLTQVYEELMKSGVSPAYRLIDISIKLDHASGFPDREIIKLAEDIRKRPTAYSMLRRLTFEHMLYFNVHYQKRQSVCAALQIKPSHTLSVPVDRKLLD